MKESSENRCPDCDTPIPEASPGGLCPRCLFGGEVDSSITRESDPGETLPLDPDNPPVRGEPSREALLTPPSGAAEFALTPEELDQLFPDFEIIKLLGAGGMGAVYQARQPRLDRIVALKVLSCAPEMHDAFALRFEREAQLLARLHHPHIVTLFDFGEIENGPGGRSVFYFLMEYIGGGSLEDRLRSEEEIRPRQAFRMVMETCEALAFAHAKGVLHRDIKPANLLLDDEERMRVADFGIAKILADDEAPLVTGLTVTGTTMGTPHYMAPELWEDPTKVDVRADLYSVGVVFYQLLTGEKPAGVFEEPSRVSNVERMVDNVVFKALEKNRERRYQDAEEMRAAVERVAIRHRQRVKRKRGKAVVAAGIAACLLGTLGWVGFEAGLFGGGNVERARAGGTGIAGDEKESVPRESGDPDTKADTLSHAIESSSLTTYAEPNDSTPVLPEFTTLPRGRLRHTGTGPQGASGDFGQAAYIDDFVSVAGSRDFWVGLRSNGETVSSDGSLDASDIQKLCASFHTHAVLIDANGQLHFREGNDKSLPESMEGIRLIDAQVSNHHGIALDGDGRAHVFGEYYEKDFEDGLGAGGYGTPKWPGPTTEALTDVQAVAVAQTHAATLKKDGSLRVFGWEGLIDLPPQVTSKTFTQVASSPDQICLLDSNGGAWRFGLVRNPHPNQPVGHAGKLLRMGPETATAVGDDTWRDEDGRWHGVHKEIDQLLDDHLPGDVPHFTRKWSGRNDVNSSLLWVEVNAENANAAPPEPAFALEVPPPLAALRERGGRLRSWTTGKENLIGLELAEGIDDLVRLHGFAGFGSDRWLAIRRNGRSVTPLADFERSGELVSLNSHLGVLRSGEIVKCYGDHQRRVLPGSAIASGYGHSNDIQFELVLHRNGEVLFRRAPDFGDWLEDQFPQVRERLAEVDDAVDIAAGANGSGMLLRASGEVIAWNQAGLWPSETPLSDAVGIALGDHSWIALRADGSLHVEPRPGSRSTEFLPPADLGPVYAIRINAAVAAAQMADGSWRAWGPERYSGLTRKIETLGPAADILFLSWKEDPHLLWIEPADGDDAAGDSPVLEVPPALKALRERGGRLRSWTAGEEEMIGLDHAEGIGDFVRLDGLAYPGSDRWLAIRSNTQSVTPLTNFDQSEELVSLDTHIGVLKDGGVLHCWDEQRILKSGDAIAIDGEAGASSRDPFWLFLNDDGTVSLTTNGDFRQWDDDEYARVRPIIEEVADAVQIEAQAGTGVILRGNGEVVSWSNNSGLFVPDPVVTNAVEVSCTGGGRWFALDSEGNVRTWHGPEADRRRFDPPKDLPPVFAIRSFGTVAAAQTADGSWRAWGYDNGSGLIEEIHSIGPAADILFLNERKGEKDALLWIEPAEPREAAEQPVWDIPPALEALRERGGRLRSWAPLEDIIGLELAEGIDDFVRLDGALYPGSDRWLAIRRDGPSITPLPDFERSGELVSLDTHLGVLRSGEIVKCYGESRKVLPGNVAESAYAGHGVQFELFRNRHGTVTLNRAFRDGQWFEKDGDRILGILDGVQDAVRIDAGPSKGIVLRRSGGVIAWNDKGLWPSDPPITDAVDVAMAANQWGAIRADGSVHIQPLQGKDPQGIQPPADLPPTFSLRGSGTVFAAQLADGSWRAWESGANSRLVEQINTMGSAVDLLFFSQGHGREDALLWIEPTGDTESSPESTPSTEISISGSLRAMGTLPDGEAIDLTNAEGIEDFVQVVLHDSGWVGLREDGTMISSDGREDGSSGIRRLLRGPGKSFGWIGRNGKLSIASGERGASARSIDVPADLEAVVDASWDEGHAIARLADGTARVWGEFYEGEFRDSPKWEIPSTEVLSDVVDVAAIKWYAGVLDGDGQLLAWGRELIDETAIFASPEIKNRNSAVGPLVEIEAFRSPFRVLSESGEVWNLGGEGIRSAGKVAAGVERISGGCIRSREMSFWSYRESDKSSQRDYSFLVGRPQGSFDVRGPDPDPEGGKNGAVIWIEPVTN